MKVYIIVHCSALVLYVHGIKSDSAAALRMLYTVLRNFGLEGFSNAGNKWANFSSIDWYTSEYRQ